MTTTAPKFDINTATADSLAQLHPDQIIKIVLALKDENKKLLENANEIVAKEYNERFERLERELNLQKQYERRTSIEITGIPASVPDDEIEDAVITVIKTAKAKAHNKFPSHLDIHAAHRKGKNGVVICKFVNRKFAYSAVSSGSNLKGVQLFDQEGAVYINPSLCPEFGFLHYAVRLAKKGGLIHSYKVRHGIMYIKKTDNPQCKEVQISHENDLGRCGIPVPKRKY